MFQQLSLATREDEVEDQNVGGSGAEEDGKSGSEKGLEPPARETCDKRSEKGDATAGAAGMVHLQHALPSSMVKNQIMARYQQLEQAMIKQAVNTGKSVMDWMNDEDFLYCRIIGVRLKRMEPRKRKRIRAQIMSLLEESENELEEDDDSMSSPNMDGGESSGYDPSLLDVT
ncbi:hypothetical protein ANCCAN_23457, partial [Ancylostoma caninum]